MINHHKDLIDLLLEELDDERNDIYCHIDIKCKEFSSSDFHLKKANLYFIRSIDTNWGGYGY